ncbi:MAG: ATP-binding protein [Lachnospiraceae bacterium]|nr:ATP-binding protein [Lachnospiraceae bacterium]
MNNPFTLAFGQQPAQFISRISQTEEIIETFTDERPSSQVYMITGIRGSGKTVMMTSIANELEQDKEWITVELNPTRDLLIGLASKLYCIKPLHTLFTNAKLDFSAFGLGVSLENSVPITDEETMIESMLKEIAKSGKRLLVTMDEVTNNEYVKVFASTFQILLRKDLPIYLLMTGLYENIYSLQNDEALTFLYRAPKIMLEPLSENAIASNYKSIFKVSVEESMKMAKLTKGYPFAFQVLGYLCWKYKDKELNEVIPEYDHYLEEYVYEKIWSELSDQDRRVVAELSSQKEIKVKELRDKLNMNSSEMSVYRNRLGKRGIVDISKYGYISLKLPRFDYYVKMCVMDME